MINLLLSCDYTVVFIGHAIEKDGYTSPKGDKRCLNPIIDNCDFVIYVKSNGVDENNNVIKSSAYLAETDKFFARSRFEHCPTVIPEFTAENLEDAIAKAVENEENINGATVVTYSEQKARNTTEVADYDETMDKLKDLGKRFSSNGLMEVLTNIVEDTLGVGKRVTECTKKQIDAMVIILENLTEKAEELNI